MFAVASSAASGLFIASTLRVIQVFRGSVFRVQEGAALSASSVSVAENKPHSSGVNSQNPLDTLVSFNASLW